MTTTISANSAQTPAPAAEPLLPAPLGSRAATFAAVILPPLGLVAAIALVWGWGVTWVDLALLAGMYLLTAVGVTVGFHRLLVHRSFDTYAAVKFALAALGSMAVQGRLLKWAAHHRRHHQHSDTAHDPHSPHRFGSGLIARVRGFWHAHIGWAFTADPPGWSRYVRDLRRSPALRVADRMFFGWVAVGLLVPAVVGGFLTESWAGAARALLWGGLVRVFLVHHVTWSVNSVGHLWGSRPHASGDQSRDNFVLGVLALGEGWHNTHHAFPTSARHGLRWWQPDASYWMIRLLALVGLAWNVRLPTRPALAGNRPAN
ncbi:MAG TPA: fatty acid desaturase [Gemmataceae bacterium]|nr:fatty acid desaturase [Gemmataceae bacterium]